ncbi:ATP-binding protein [Pyrococcus kukulkanii]|uniref:ATP-binding protein n=1 Tax=Pyrococcus kukulkanii TaxID=1609559 RepID=UPI003562604A
MFISCNTIRLIMFQQFVDRKRELEELEKSWESDKPELIVIYGRRRVGKTGSSPREFLWAHVGVHSPRFCGCPGLDRPTHSPSLPVHYGGTGCPNTRRVQPALHLT